MEPVLGPKAPVHHSVQVKGKGDHAEGRLGVDIILVERQQPDYDTARYAGMAFLRAKAELYRDQDTKTDWIFLTQEDFKTRCRSITTAEGRALDDGYILGDDAEYYRALGRRRMTQLHTRWANDCSSTLRP